jgi:hypothetical protein
LLSSTFNQAQVHALSALLDVAFVIIIVIGECLAAVAFVVGTASPLAVTATTPAFSVTTIMRMKSIIDAENKPDNLPDPKEIVWQCRAARAARANSSPDSEYLSGVALVDESGDAYVWVKFGQSITMGEAQTQHYAGQVLNNKANAAVRVPHVYLAFKWGKSGYIVMEYISGSTCVNSDAVLVADAVRSLITVQGPSTVPGPVGGGPINHRFFVDWMSSVTYHSVEALEKHVNGVRFPPVPLAPLLVSG